MKVYKYFKQGCIPCQTLGKILKQLDHLDLEIVERDIAIEENKQFLLEKGIDRVPILVLEDGRFTTLKPKAKIEKFLLGIEEKEE